MFIPLRDENRPGALFPIVNWSLIIANAVIFMLQVQYPNITYRFSMVPHEIVTGKDITRPKVIDYSGTTGLRETVIIPHEPTPVTVYITLLTSMFLHGNLLHLVGNMLFLWIFGDNLEDALGRVRYLLFYLCSGLIAALSHILVSLGEPARYIPTLGASGAVSGVLGGYIYLFPRSQVTGILVRFLVTLPASWALGIWFAYQLVMALLDAGGGVAYMAHVGGFVGGLLLVILLGTRSDYAGGYAQYYGIELNCRSWGRSSRRKFWQGYSQM